MGRPAEIERHARRMEIDYLIANRAPRLVIAEAFDLHEQTIRRYRARMLADEPGYFTRIKLPGPPSDLPTVFKDAATYAARLRRHWLNEAETAFTRPSN